MRLLTHNLLACHSKRCVSTSLNFPLSFNQVKVELIEADFNPEFIINFLPKIHWAALVEASRQLGDSSLPEQSPDLSNVKLDEASLKALHHVLLEIHVTEGEMICKSCSHSFKIRNGIPNMLLAEHEIIA